MNCFHDIPFTVACATLDICEVAITGFSKMLCLFCCCYLEAVDSVTSVFTQLHSPGFNQEFSTLYELISQVVAALWQRKGKINGSFKGSTPSVLKQCLNKVSFQCKVLVSYQNFCEIVFYLKG